VEVNAMPYQEHQEYQECDMCAESRVFTRLLGRMRAQYRKMSAPVAWGTIALLWAVSGVAGVSIANSTYRVFGDVSINALGSDSFDILVSGSSDAGWTPDSSGVSDWEQGNVTPYVVDIPQASALLTPGRTVWTSVAVKNASASASGSVQVTLRDAYAADPAYNLFMFTRFTLQCDGVTLFTQESGQNSDRMAALRPERVLAPGETMLCRVGVALDEEVLGEGFKMSRQSLVVPQLLFEGEQR
jgi:hypothetical protein